MTRISLLGRHEAHDLCHGVVKTPLSLLGAEAFRIGPPTLVVVVVFVVVVVVGSRHLEKESG
jgi:hypothetical protein